MKQLLLVVSPESRQPADEGVVVFVRSDVRATEVLFAMQVTGGQELRMFFSFPGRNQPPPGKRVFDPGG